MPFHVVPFSSFWRSKFFQGSLSIRVIVERGDKFKVTPVAAEEGFSQVNQAVNGFFELCQFICLCPVPMFHLAVVFEE